jgi:hypothetical protein
MEAVIDKLSSELSSFMGVAAAYGGCYDTLPIQAVFWGDPGIIPAFDYPCFVIEPVRDSPLSENMGSERRELEVTVQLLQDARDDFNASANEANGDRKRVQTMGNLRKWLRRLANRQLDGQEGVLDVKVTNTDYTGQVRGSVIAKSASITLLVQKQYSREA